jgi:cell volume regulation protein A
MLEGIEKSDIIFHLVFFISVTSVLIQGTTLPLVARWLHVDAPQKKKRLTVLDLELSDTMKSELIEVTIPEQSKVVGKAIVKLGFPQDSMIVLLGREGKYLQPNGATTLLPNDKLLILARTKEVLDEVKERLGIPVES